LLCWRFWRRTIIIVFNIVTAMSLSIATVLDHFSGNFHIQLFSYKYVQSFVLFFSNSQIFLPEGSSTLALVSIVTSYVGKLSVTASIITLYLYTPELYPTNIRYVVHSRKFQEWFFTKNVLALHLKSLLFLICFKEHWTRDVLFNFQDRGHAISFCWNTGMKLSYDWYFNDVQLYSTTV
jgi:hypothetical protein